MLSISRSSLLARLGPIRSLCPAASSRWKSSSLPRKEEEEFASDSDIKISTKPTHHRLEKRNPLMKNMFIGVVDTDLLVYPESLNRDEQSRVVSERESYERIVKTSEPNELPQKLRNAGVFGLQSPLNHGGKQLIETELAYFSEIISKDFRTGLVAGQHNAIVQLLDRFGSDLLKEKCMEALSSGRVTVSSALFEEEAPSGTMFSTIATQDMDQKRWILNGAKSFVIDGDKAGYFLVLASTKDMDQMSAQDTTITAFLVDASEKGVRKAKADETFGLNDVKQVTVSFENVEIGEENILGSEGTGAEVLVELLKSTRVQTSVLGVQLMKQFLNSLTRHCIETKTGGGHIMDIENVSEELAKATCSVYAAESMIYLTTGLLDDFIGQDAEMEAAITKIFTAEKLMDMAIQPLRFVGQQALTKGHPLEALFRNSVQFFGQSETIDSVKFFVALSGLQHAGMATHETIRKDRNPAMNPSHVISKIFEKNTIDNPKQFVNLEHFMHPSLDPAAHWVEFSIMRLKLATECVLSRHGSEVIGRHIELIRLADMAVLIYAMVATSARASRAYCIGLRHAEQEIYLANAFCQDAQEKVRVLAKQLEQGQFITNDTNYGALARYLFKQKEYFFEHPLTKNF
ncbi:complex I assembly factor ACAD9, mitochondrial [Ochlerotatus camptorhynchus]|uniref:complex I assembly factor ACAD9, mitochondrial n=1 Tax=Ochlerotatus camptorhynchus TaxID=644619 RepID=UPI0031CE820B